MSHVLHMNESCDIYGLSHGAYMKETCHTCELRHAALVNGVVSRGGTAGHTANASYVLSYIIEFCA